MPLVDIEVGLTEQQLAVCDVAHKYAEEVLRPAGSQLDRLEDPADVIAPDSVLWDVFEKHRALGLADLESENVQSICWRRKIFADIRGR